MCVLIEKEEFRFFMFFQDLQNQKLIRFHKFTLRSESKLNFNLFVLFKTLMFSFTENNRNLEYLLSLISNGARDYWNP